MNKFVKVLLCILIYPAVLIIAAFIAVVVILAGPFVFFAEKVFGPDEVQFIEEETNGKNIDSSN